MANTTYRSLCENTYGCGYIGDLSYFTFVSVVVIVIIDRGFLIGVVGGHRRRVCHAWKLRLKRRIKLSYFYFLTSRRKLIFNFTHSFVTRLLTLSIEENTRMKIEVILKVEVVN